MLATLALPLSAQDLREVVRQARPYNPDALDRVLRLDAARGLVEAQASATWERLIAYLRPEATEEAAAWSGLPTLGESLATNAPGPDGRPVSVHVESLALVTADGELRRVSRTLQPELFALALGGHGVFGALYSATLRLESLSQASANAAAPVRLRLSAGDTEENAPLRLLVPPEALDGFLSEARTLCAQWRVELRSLEVRRTCAEEETALRWAVRDYALVAIALARLPALGGAVRTTQLRRQLVDSAIAHGGSFPIACTPDATRAQVERCYPRIRAFLAEKRRVDPADKLSNEWYRHLRSLLAREDCEVRWG